PAVRLAPALPRLSLVKTPFVMRLVPSVASLLALIAGVVLLIVVLNAYHTAPDAISASGMPPVRTLLLIVGGVLCLLYGGVATIF
ncbi:hypothetical protein NL317_30225, partial [Klebsiella pneumoniae]|nr:hypothetical protein [Klebsiella pneumoniae]